MRWRFDINGLALNISEKGRNRCLILVLYCSKLKNKAKNSLYRSFEQRYFFGGVLAGRRRYPSEGRGGKCPFGNGAVSRSFYRFAPGRAEFIRQCRSGRVFPQFYRLRDHCRRFTDQYSRRRTVSAKAYGVKFPGGGKIGAIPEK